MSKIQSVTLTQGRSGESVVADLVNLRDKNVEDFDLLWQPLLQEFGQDDKAVSWRFKQQLAERQPNWEGYAIEYDSLTQGLLLLETQYHGSFFDGGNKLVYVEIIMTAPWNRRGLQRSPEFTGVGRQMMQFSRQRSLELGYQGRVGLKALPGAIGFYERIGMSCLELEPEEIVDPEDALPYFEYRALRQSEDREYDN